MINDLKAAFEKFADQSFEFHLIKNPLYNSPDICALVLLHKLAPSCSRNMIAGAEHDVIYFSVDIEKLAQVASEEDIIYLRRCGVMFDEKTDSLAMFV